MTAIAAVLVVFHQATHPESVDATIDAIRQFGAVAGIQTIFDDVGKSITDIRLVREELRASTLERARAAGV